MWRIMWGDYRSDGWQQPLYSPRIDGRVQTS